MKKLLIFGFSLLLFISCCDNKTSNSENLELVKAMYAFNTAGEKEKFIDLLDDNILWLEAENYIYADKNPYNGKQAVIDGLFSRIGSEWDNFRLDNLVFYDMKDNMVLVTGRYKATNKTTGKEINAQMAHHWTIGNGKAIKFQQYVDTKQVYEATLK